MLITTELQNDLFAPHAREQLAQIASVLELAADIPAEQQFPQLLAQADICLTGWGAPQFTSELLAKAPHLKLLAHTAGSVHFLHPEKLFTHGVKITHSNAALAEGVAEFTIMQALLCLRQAWILDQEIKQDEPWRQISGKLLRTQHVGIVGVGSIGLRVIELLRPFGCSLVAYDPYLSPEVAEKLGVELVDLEALFATSDIVSLHLPHSPVTHNLITARHLELLHDGGVFLNNARAGVIEEEALLQELQSGRIVAALDVFHEEPLPPDALLRRLPNVFLSPHIAALTTDTLLLQGQMMVDEIGRFIRGEALRYEVLPEKLATMA
jgi:phosphoglycerate dehydrogenase-like enzyme